MAFPRLRQIRTGLTGQKITQARLRMVKVLCVCVRVVWIQGRRCLAMMRGVLLMRLVICSCRAQQALTSMTCVRS